MRWSGHPTAPAHDAIVQHSRKTFSKALKSSKTLSMLMGRGIGRGSNHCGNQWRRGKGKGNTKKQWGGGWPAMGGEGRVGLQVSGNGREWRWLGCMEQQGISTGCLEEGGRLGWLCGREGKGLNVRLAIWKGWSARCAVWKEDEKFQSSTDREGGVPIVITIKESDINGFLAKQEFGYGKFVAPCLVHMFPDSGSNIGSASSSHSTAAQRKFHLIFYCIPVSSGKSRLIWSFPRNFSVWIDQIVPRWMFHVGQNLILDSDMYLLHVEDFVGFEMHIAQTLSAAALNLCLDLLRHHISTAAVLCSLSFSTRALKNTAPGLSGTQGRGVNQNARSSNLTWSSKSQALSIS
ncbi:hypothetical protein M5K25_014380 [Dendrobium thyrsiflorum]|uniref:Pheophorbide a oxygenase domain-containing protein n=1 Tax=Dendrobium thyrsiflorum TaxID=117978 RepID=A0ABD0V2N6_DENTH